jgi:hypothetical protein
LNVPPVFADKNDPDYLTLGSILANIKAEAEVAPRAVMQHQRPPATYPACRYVYRPGEIRDAPR